MTADSAVFMRSNAPRSEPTVVYSHVDDLIVFGVAHTTERYGDEILKKFDARDFGEPELVLGMHVAINKQNKTISIDQTALIDGTLRRFGVGDRGRARTTPINVATDDKPAAASSSLSHAEQSRYMAIVGSCLYVANATRPDISFAASFLAQYMHSATEWHLGQAWHLLNYLAATRHLKLVYGLRYQRPEALPPLSADQQGLDVYVYTDASFGDDPVTRRSRSGMLIFLNGAPIVWGSKKQHLVAPSTSAAETIAAQAGIMETQVLQRICTELLGRCIAPTPLLMDASNAIKWLSNPLQDTRSKYVAVHFSGAQEAVANGVVRPIWVPSSKQVADFLTKRLSPKVFIDLIVTLCLHKDASLAEC